jgi:hypothetical protein
MLRKRKAHPGNALIWAIAVCSLLTALCFSACAGAACVSLPSELVSWWTGDGTTDDEIGGNNGTVMNGAVYAPGLVGQAFSFDGVDDYVEIPHAASLDLTGGMTLEAWFKLRAPGYSTIFSKADFNGTESVTSYGLQINPDGAINAALYGTYPEDNWTTVGGLVAVDQWYHVALTWDGTYGPSDNVKLYLNGSLIQTWTKSPAPLNVTTQTLTLGSMKPPTYYGHMDGLIDEAGIFSRALTAEEIAAIHAAGSAGKCRPCVPPPTGTVSWWPGDGNANDIIGTNDGTMMNGATYAAGMVRQAFSVDGIDDYIQLPKVSTWDFGTSSFSITGWFKSGTAGDYRNIIRYDTASAGSGLWGVRFNPAGEVEFIIAPLSRTVYSVITTSSYADDNWHFVAAVRDSANGKLKIYIDGSPAAPDASEPGIDVIGAANAYPAIGRCGSFAIEHFAGLIDEVGTFNRALSAEEIAAIYAAGSTGMCASGSPDISVDLSEHDFGLVSRGESEQQTFTVSNNGSADLTIGDLTVDPMGDFAVLMVYDTCSNSTVAPASSCTFMAQFSAYMAGVKNATLHIPSNDPDTGTLDVSLSGTSYYTLTVSVTPTDGGTVTGVGINCGEGNTDCTGAITVHDQGVELTATPAAGSTFLRWEGDAGGSTNPVAVQMSDHKNVTALFATYLQVCPTCAFTSIQDALDVAQAGDTIKLLKDTTYHENILIETNKEITISGGWDSTFTTQTPDPFLTRIDGDVDGDGFGDGSVITLLAGASERIDVELRNLTIQNGNALNPGAINGGGIRTSASGGGEIDLRLEDVIVAGNRAKEAGGGLYAHANGGTMTVRMTNTMVIDNDAMNVGAIEFFVDGEGGTGALSLVNTTAAGNRADWVGGLYVGGQYGGVVTADIMNSILWGNLSRTDGGDITHYQYLGTTTINASTTDIGTIQPAPGYSGTYNGALTNISLDPVFVNPALWDYRLHEDSPAIDTGDGSGAPGLDFEGEARDLSPDMGADEFVSAPPATAIKLLSLNSGEIIDSGRPHDIVWEAPDTAQSFKVFYTLDNGLTWLKAKPGSTDPAYTGNMVNGYCHYRWNVPVLTKNKKAKVKVVGYTGNNGTGAKVRPDVTDVPVLLRTVQLLTPNGGETLTGPTYTIRWETTEGPKAPVDSVKLSYTVNNGVTWKMIEAVTDNPGTYSWILPEILKPKLKCKVKVELKDAAEKTIGSDVSDSVFAIDLDR